jgi:hypothetical protein
MVIIYENLYTASFQRKAVQILCKYRSNKIAWLTLTINHSISILLISSNKNLIKLKLISLYIEWNLNFPFLTPDKQYTMNHDTTLDFANAVIDRV